MNQGDEIALLRDEIASIRKEVSELRRFQSWLMGGLAVLGGVGVLFVDKFKKLAGLG